MLNDELLLEGRKSIAFEDKALAPGGVWGVELEVWSEE
jgi:hypothetical protein